MSQPLPQPAPEPRVEIDHSGDGTTASFAKDDLEARAAVKAAGFRWSGNLGAWFLPRPWSESTRRMRVRQVVAVLGEDAVTVDDAGRAPVTSAAQREEEARAAAAERAARMSVKAERKDAEADARFGRAREISDHIPFGQPILVGHHSEGRHRRDIARIDANHRAGFAAQQEAAQAARAARNAQLAAAGDSPLLRQRRIDRKSAELRGVQRELAALDAKGGREAAPSWYDQQVALRDRLADEIAHDQQQIAASGHRVFTPADIAKGDRVTYRGRAYTVKKVNKTTVSVPTAYSWDDKLPINQITRVEKAEELGIDLT